MSEKLPYEELMEQQFEQLPLPDEEQSWQKMKMLLEEDDDDDRILPPIFLRGCLGWGLLVILLVFGLWFIFHTGKPQEKDLSSIPSAKTKQQKPPGHATTSRELTTDHNSIVNNKKTGTEKKQNAAIPTEEGIENTSPKEKPRQQLPSHDAPNSFVTAKTKAKISKTKRAEPTAQANKKPKIAKANRPKDTADSMYKDLPLAHEEPLPTKDSTADHEKIGEPEQQDSAVRQIAITDSLLHKDSSEQKKQQKPLKKTYVSAGLGLQQLIPFNGQQLTPYGYYGRKGSLADYIPSVYIRFHKEEKWFLQAEFRYGAPQSVRQFTYDQQTTVDTLGTVKILTTSVLSLKKTFYHQIPVSFNYVASPHWTIGAGLVYNKFYSAITENNSKILDLQTMTETFSKKIVNSLDHDSVSNYTGSFFTNSQLNLLFQAGYQWRKFSFALRYSFGLQPFIRYQTPTGEMKDETNQSLQFLVKYRLWQSKR